MSLFRILPLAAWIGLLPAAPALAHVDVHQRIDAVTRTIETRTDGQGYLARAELNRVAGEFQAAAADLDRAAGLDPGLPGLSLCRAALALDQGRFREAGTPLAEYLARRPDDPKGWTVSGRVAAGEERWLDAARAFGRAIDRTLAPSPDLFVARAGALVAAGPGHLAGALAALEEGMARLGPVISLELAALEVEQALGDRGAATRRLDRLAAGSARPEAWLARRAELERLAGRSREAGWMEAAALAAGRRMQPMEVNTGVSDVARTVNRPVALPAPAVADRVATPAGIAAVVTRAPYLLQGGHDRITVRWRTDVSHSGRVRYGTSLLSLTLSADDPAVSTEHQVTLTGLAPDTRYYYSVGTSAGPLAGGDAAHSFVTSPVPGTAKPTRLWVIGDSGTANAQAMAVRDAFASYSAGHPADLWLMLGDNAYPSGTDAEYQAAVFSMYPTMLRTTPLWPTRGNHDVLYAGANNDYYDLFTLPTAGEVGGLPSGTEAYYSFDYGNLHLICLDSEGSDRSVGGPMAVWLRADLAATPRDWVIAFWHHPTYSKGSHDSDNEADSGGRMGQMRRNILPILDSAGVDLVLAGHSHSYERSLLLNGHYGTSATLTQAMKVDAGNGRWDGDGAYAKPSLGTGPREGCVYTVAGTGGQVSGGTYNHPVMVSSLALLGSLVIDVSGPRLDSRFLDSQGAVRDSFTIVKGVTVGVGEVKEGGLPALAILGAQPSRGSVRLAYRLDTAARATLVMLDALGRRVRTLRSGPHPAGRHEALWDGCDETGRACPPGVYFAVLDSQGRSTASKVVRLGP